MLGSNMLTSRQKMIRRKKNVKKGIQFCLMVCGASGTGTSRILLVFTLASRLHLRLPSPFAFACGVFFYMQTTES